MTPLKTYCPEGVNCLKSQCNDLVQTLRALKCVENPDFFCKDVRGHLAQGGKAEVCTCTAIFSVDKLIRKLL